MMVAVHQVLPSLHVADAAGLHTLRVRDALRAAGMQSEIFFVESVDPPLAREARRFAELDRHVTPGRTAILYQLAVGSPVADVLLHRPEPLLVNYHNLTPASFYWQWAPSWLVAVETGRQQLHRLAARTVHAIAVSSFNERDLVAAGYRSTAVVPPLVDVGSLSRRRSDDGPDGPHGGDAGDGGGAGDQGGPVGRTGAEGDPGDGGATPRTTGRCGARWLFVGKLLPHKAAHHVVRALAAYRRAYDPEAHLVLVGGHPIPEYAEAVESYADELGLGAGVELAGTVSDQRLDELYRTSDVFVCLSDHEGFCFPLLEAMQHGLPVVAATGGAVADTLGSGGVLLADKSPGTVAAAVHGVMRDPERRTRLIAAGRQRVAQLDPSISQAALVAEVRRGLVLAGVPVAPDRRVGVGRGGPRSG
jgi:glycosyltransferase involved in cell wall biosynthesis